MGRKPCDSRRHEAPPPLARTRRPDASTPGRHDRHAPRTGPAGGADRLVLVRGTLGRLLPLPGGAARTPPTPDRGPDVPAARPRPLRRGRPRPLGGEPVLPALHRRGVLPAPIAAAPLLAQPLARPD